MVLDNGANNVDSNKSIETKQGKTKKSDDKKKALSPRLLWLSLPLLLGVIVASALYLKDHVSTFSGNEGIITEERVEKPSPLIFLPEEVRAFDENEDPRLYQVRDPFAGTFTLKGLLSDGGASIAIVEAGSKAYITQVGQEIAGGWKVEQIHGDGVVLLFEDRALLLTFDGVKDWPIEQQ
ncbi:hypothetical protein [Heliorestis convoluta]|uniref:Type IV pilus biogenesis family protein n=1 Tax=Heliorestis convoluta TaxID=356322 RepID=A0A5Q2MZG1_9FIRM|nr:hypothetical protein [Heliorestis convoluta]QGG46586.1 type IV pilus biogenesis family protein [Heliorestis convoluta]